MVSLYALEMERYRICSETIVAAKSEVADVSLAKQKPFSARGHVQNHGREISAVRARYREIR
jgi:hypothetical protein